MLDLHEGRAASGERQVVADGQGAKRIARRQLAAGVHRDRARARRVAGCVGDQQEARTQLIAIFKPIVNCVIVLGNWSAFVARVARPGELAGGYELKRRDILDKGN